MVPSKTYLKFKETSSQEDLNTLNKYLKRLSEISSKLNNDAHQQTKIHIHNPTEPTDNPTNPIRNPNPKDTKLLTHYPTKQNK